MKILRLELRAFGPFTDEGVDLSAGEPGFHLIVGPNEAGKSSALRALRSFFYGIPTRSADNFLHPHTQMRIGAALQAADGRLLELVRRKGNRQTLRDGSDETPIDEAVLARLLGGIDEASFCRRYGLGYDDLVQGGRDLVSGGGDLGHSLFAAASGIANLSAAQAQLAAEAEKLFAPSARVREINKAVAEFQQRQREIKECLLPTARWREHDRALQEANEQRSMLAKKIDEISGRQSLLKRVAGAMPLAARRRQTLTDLAPLADVPLLSEDFSEQRRKATTAADVAAKRAEREKEEIVRLSTSLDEQLMPPAVLQHAQAVRQMQLRLGSHTKAMDDRRLRIAERKTALATAEELLRELGRTDLALDQAEQLRLTADERVRIQSLGREKSKLVERAEHAQASHGQLCEQLEEVRRQQAELAAPRDALPLRAALAAAREAGPLEKQLALLQAQQQAALDDAEISLRKLRGWSGTIAQLEQLALPASETIDRFQQALDDVGQAQSAVRRRLADDEQEAHQLDEQIEQLRRAQDVPTEDDLAAARQLRDRGWELVRQELAESPTDAAAVAAFAEHFPNAGDLLQTYAMAVAHADDIADRLRREAAQVAEKVARRARREALQRRLHAAREEQAKLGEEAEQKQREWLAEWAPLKIEPRSPREMHAWLRQAQQLCEAARQERLQLREIEQLQVRLVEHVRAISAALETVGETAPPAGAALAALLPLGDAASAACDQEKRLHVQLADEQQKLQHEVAKSAKLIDTSAQKLAAWAEQWTSATRVLRLREGAEPDEASAAVESSNALLVQVNKADDLAQRIAGIDRDAEQFQADIQRICAIAAPHLASDAVERAAVALGDFLDAAQAIHTRRMQAEEQLSVVRARLETTEQERQHASAMLKALCSEARCQRPEELPATEQEARRRSELQRALAEQEDRLLELAGGEPLEAFVESLAQHETEHLAAEVQRLEQELAGLREELSNLDQTIGHQQAQLDQMDGNARAAEARQAAEQLLAKIRGDAEQYARLRLAAVVLARSIERYREQNQGPVLERASDVFATLTLGRFEALRADLDDAGNAVLVGVRSGSREVVHVEGMSDGTCDQLYLALRLASLEMDLASSREPLPLVVDDVLIKFDDARAAAALKVLAALSQRTQVIMFTHHDHLVRLARKTLNDEVLFTHTLDSRRRLASATT